MNKPKSSSVMLLAAMLAAAAGVAAYQRRPVKQPERAGNWQPADSQRTRR